MQHVKLTTNDTVLLLKQSPDRKVQEFAKDTAVVAALMRVFNSSLDIAASSNGSPAGIALAMSQKGLETVKLGGVAADSNALNVGTAVVSVSMANKALAGLSNASPGKLLTTAGLVTIEKLLILGGMQNKHKCEIAIASLASTAGLTIVAAPTGVGLVVGVIGVLAQGIEAYGACQVR